MRVLALIGGLLVCAGLPISAAVPDPSPTERLLELNRTVDGFLERLATVDTRDPARRDRQIADLRRDVDAFVLRSWTTIEGLTSSAAAHPEDVARLVSKLELAKRGTAAPDALDRLLAESLDSKFRENDRTNIYALTAHNRFRYLDEGRELRDEVLETIRVAETFVHLSYFELYPDRMGHLVAGLLIAKRLGFRKPCDIDRVLGALGLPRLLNGDDCADVPVETGPLASEAFAFPGRDRLLANAAVLARSHQARGPVAVRLYLDDFKRLQRKLTGAGIIQALEAFGIEVHKEDAVLAWGSNHTKIASNERRAVVSGGNIVDKVMDWVPRQRRWRDAAMLVEGELVRDLNHFFLARFHGVKHWELTKHLCDDAEACLRGYFPELTEDEKTSMTAEGRLVWTSNFDVKESPTWKALGTIIGRAQHSLYFENAFFSDGLSALLIRGKAREWQLRRAKDLNTAHGEAGRKATCGPDYFEVVAARPGGKFILVVLPRHMDQPMVKAAEKVLTNHLLWEGVDVCLWDSELNNRVHGTARTKFAPRTMMHSKVFLADDNLVYVGTANLNRRSMLGDLEVGILTNDRVTVREIREKMFVNDVQASAAAKFSVLHYLYMPLQLLLNFILWLT
ncbi:MAG: phosphatidylserine/phosphatidylglycerophosphate/cardiolipin synthase family protein [Vicinamibacterales bacterium]